MVVLAIALALSLLWRFTPATGAGSDGSEAEPSPSAAAPAPEPAEAPSEPAREDVPRLVLHDRLTGEPLGAPWLDLVGSGARIELSGPVISGESWPEGNGWRLDYPANVLPEAPVVSRAWAEVLEGASLDDQGELVGAVPYASRLEGVVLEEGSGAPVAEVTVRAALVQPELWRQAADFPARSPLVFYAGYGGTTYRMAAYDYLRALRVPPSEGMTHDDLLRVMGSVLSGQSDQLPDGMRAWLERADELLPITWVTATTNDQGRFSLTLPGSGHVVVHLWDAPHGSRWLEADTAPGETVHLEPVLSRRPVVEVVVYDEAGLPLAGQQVGIGALLDPADFDYTATLERDSFDVSAGIGAEGRTRRVVWFWGDTDDRGRYRRVVPRALDYAATAIRGPRYADAYASQALGEGGPWPETVSLVLDFSDQSERPKSTAVFYGEDGEVLAGATVKFTVANDMPWVRQWPTWETDERGEIRLAWFRPGEFVAAKVTVPGKDGEADQVFYAMPQVWRKDLNTFHTEPASR